MQIAGRDVLFDRGLELAGGGAEGGELRGQRRDDDLGDAEVGRVAPGVLRTGSPEGIQHEIGRIVTPLDRGPSDQVPHLLAGDEEDAVRGRQRVQAERTGHVALHGGHGGVPVEAQLRRRDGRRSRG